LFCCLQLCLCLLENHRTASGPAYYINKARIVRGNIKAGKSIIHETSSIVVPPEYQDMLDALVPADDSAPVASIDATTAGSTTTAPTGTTTAGSTTNVKDAVASGSTTTATTTTEAPASRVLAANSTTTRSSGSSATMAAALLAVPALLAVLL
jgi:hypothetical protein